MVYKTSQTNYGHVLNFFKNLVLVCFIKSVRTENKIGDKNIYGDNLEAQCKIHWEFLG